MTLATQDQAKTLLSDLHFPQTPDMIAAAQAWLTEESGGHNNPLNLRAAGDLGWYQIYGAGAFGSFSTYALGLQADANNLLSGASRNQFGYDKVVQAGDQGNAIGFLQALAASSWDAGHYGAKQGTNNLITLYDDITGSTYSASTSGSGSAQQWDTKPPINGVCSSGYVKGSEVRQVLMDNFGQLPIFGGIIAWFSGQNFNEDTCYSRSQLSQSAFQAAQNAGNNPVSSTVGAIGDAAFTFGIILLGAAVLIAGVLLMRSNNGS